MALTLRLTLTYLLVTLAGVLLLGAGFVVLAERELASQRERELSAQAEIFAALLGELATTPAALQALAPSSLGADLLPSGTSARIFSTTGARLAGDPDLGPFPSRAALELMRPPLPLPASQASLRRYVAAPIGGADGPIGVLELSRDSSDDLRFLAGVRRLAVQAAVVAAAVVALVSLLVARTIAGPIVALTRRAEALAATLDPGAATSSGAPAAAIATHWSPGAWLVGLARTRELAALDTSLDRLSSGLHAYIARIGELEQSRSRFYRGVSHELRTPLTAISAGLENLADRVPAAQRPALLTLEVETARLSRLVDELIERSARGADDGRFTLTNRSPVDLGGLVAEVCALLEGRARRAGVDLRGGGPSLKVDGDRDRLKQALLNMADNALRVTPPGGTVLIAAARAGALARLAVMDEGPGVPVELRERIWERGVRGGDEETDGSAGLGLAITREIAAAHGGRAYLDERYGPGARFVIELPLLEA